ncbi:sialidase family protein [Pollutibacter soli]|uniref:sialidase family protein n=1 Tax=Pollutibacter soli TaxID=3034157 RepID=UPI003013F68E
MMCSLLIFWTLGSNAQQAAFTDTLLLFEPNRDGYSIYHCPALLVTKKGTILAFAEGRYGKGKDHDEMDLVYRRSTNGGQSWENSKVLMPFTKGKPTSNITPIADRNGTVHLIYQNNYSNVFYLKSIDEGKTWSKAKDITYAFDAFKSEYNWKVVAPGPGHAIQLRKGRLVVPAWLCIPNKNIPGGDHRPSCVVTVYSDDNGNTWKRGSIIANNGDIASNNSADSIFNPSESVLIELADGRVMINMRNEALANRRVVAISPDGATNWTRPYFDNHLFEPVCQSSMVRFSGSNDDKTRILFANPDSRNNSVSTRKSQKVYRPRENITVRMSYDEGNTWPVSKVLHEKGSGYSDLQVDSNGTIYALYEIRNGNDNDWVYRVVVRRFNLEWMTEGKDFISKRNSTAAK